jgi:Prp8 binding protein
MHEPKPTDPNNPNQLSDEFDSYGLAFQTSTILKGHTGHVLQLQWSTDGSNIVSCSSDNTAALFDVERATRIKRYNHKSIVNSVCLSRRSDTMLITASDDCSANVYDVRTHVPIHTFDMDYQNLAVAISDDSTQCFVAGIDELIHCFDLRTHKELYSLCGHQDSITGLEVSRDGRYLLSNSMDNTVRMWDIRPFIMNKMQQSQLPPTINSSNNNSISLSSPSRLVRVFTGHNHDFSKQLLRCSWSSDGSKISCGSADAFVNIWNSQTGEQLYKLPGHKGSVNDVVFHPTDNIIASCGNDKKIFLGEIIGEQ